MPNYLSTTHSASVHGCVYWFTVVLRRSPFVPLLQLWPLLFPSLLLSERPCPVVLVSLANAFTQVFIYGFLYLYSEALPVALAVQ